MERGDPGAAGAGCRGKRSWLLLWRLKEVTRREAKQGLADHSISSSAQNALATLNADIANEFAHKHEARHSPGIVFCCW
ncbi:hypothetical protein D3C78_1309980 [compost metagenome]